MLHTLELQIPSMVRIMAEMGRTQITRLIAETLWDGREHDGDDSQRDWYDAEKINSPQFWDDLVAVATHGDGQAASRIVQHILYYRPEFSRVINVPREPLAAIAVSLLPADEDRLVAGRSGRFRWSPRLLPCRISLGLETDCVVSAPGSFRATGITAGCTGLTDLALEPVREGSLKLDCGPEPLVRADLVPGQGQAGVGTEDGQPVMVLTASDCSVGTYLIHFTLHFTLHGEYAPVGEYPQTDGNELRRDVYQVESTHAARVRVF